MLFMLQKNVQTYTVCQKMKHVTNIRLKWMHVYLARYTEYGFFTEFAIFFLFKQYIKLSNVKY